MNLFLRLIGVWLRAVFAATHRPLTAPRALTFSVWITDQDMFMHMTNSRYLSFADLGRVDLVMRTKLSQMMNRKGWRTEICGQSMTINRMLKAPKSFSLETQLCGWDGQYIAISQTFLRRGKNHASVNTLLKIQDKSGNPIPPQLLIDLIEPELGSPALPGRLSQLIEQTNSAATNT